MTKFFKNQKGVTLIMLMIIIVILAILATIVVANIDTGADIRNYNYMCADIELLESKIMVYYNKNGTIPTKGEPISITSAELNGGEENSRDEGGNYYQINIEVLNNVTLNYGGGTLENKDIYIINEQSHEVYYLKGATYEDTLYHTPFN